MVWYVGGVAGGDRVGWCVDGSVVWCVDGGVRYNRVASEEVHAPTLPYPPFLRTRATVSCGIGDRSCTALATGLRLRCNPGTTCCAAM